MWKIINKVFSKCFTRQSETVAYEQCFSASLEKNEQVLKKAFDNINDINYKHMQIEYANHKAKLVIIYISNLVDKKLINENIIKPIQLFDKGKEYKNNYSTIKLLKNYIISLNNIDITEKITKAVDGILSGKTIVLTERQSRCLLISTEGWKERSITEPKVEKTTRGPKVSFIENAEVNISLIRRRIKSNKLKVESYTLGKYSHTIVFVLYMDNIANKGIVEEVKRRISRISADNIINELHIAELIEDNPQSPFETFFLTERPDVVSAGLMEGRVSIIVDNNPTTILVPKLFVENLISPDDYYSRFWFTFFLRQIRLIGIFVSAMLPALYVSIIAFHKEVIPMTLVSRIYSSRSGIPFSIFIELLIFGIFFEGIKEATSRVPSVFGSSISIIGTLIVGQAAITAGFLSADGVIIGAITAISSFLIPTIELSNSLILIRFLFLLSANIAGLYGMILVALCILMHLVSLRSFGIPFLTPIAPLFFQDLKDVIVRVPYIFLKNRPQSLESNNDKNAYNNITKKYFFKLRTYHDDVSDKD